MGKLNKVNTAWEQLFEKYEIAKHIESEGTYEISADTIKEFREPRLMTKFDWSNSRPELFKKNKLSILPNTRGTYVIGKFKAYMPLDYEEIRPISISMPSWIRTFDDFKISSESVALNVAQMTGMIDYVMETADDEPHAVETITGRLKSGRFDFNIDLENRNNAYPFSVSNSQIEIDAGFENLNKLAIIEAKNIIPKDFMIRQLYYPYIGYDKLNTGKEIIPIYFTHADDVFGFHIFEFKNAKNYSSLKKIKQINFILDEELDISLENIKQISRDSPNEKETVSPPYPQADSFSRVLDLLEQLEEGPKNKWKISEDFGFHERQSDYYGDALLYLGLAVRNKNHEYELTNIGKRIASMPNNNTRNRIVIEQILRHETFNLFFKETLKHYGELDDQFIIEKLFEMVPNISESTINRRKSSVKSWISWILNTATAE